MKSWGEIIFGTKYILSPLLQFVGENSAKILLLEIFWAETPALRIGDSDLPGRRF
jgi:hypothetical protein